MLVVSATRVRTGEARLFHGAAVTAQVLLASACLPQLFPAVEIEGEPYWDGGYASNPPLRALIVAGAPADVLAPVIAFQAELGGENHPVTSISNGASNQALVVPIAIDIGRVKKEHPELNSPVDRGDGLAFVCWPV